MNVFELRKLKAEILAKCPKEVLDRGNYHEIADVVSEGRVSTKETLVGFGTILDVLGPRAGALALDAFESLVPTVPEVKWTLKLLDKSNLDLGLSSTRMQLDQLVPAILTQEQANALKALAEIPQPVTWFDCNLALDLED